MSIAAQATDAVCLYVLVLHAGVAKWKFVHACLAQRRNRSHLRCWPNGFSCTPGQMELYLSLIDYCQRMLLRGVAWCCLH